MVLDLTWLSIIPAIIAIILPIIIMLMKHYERRDGIEFTFEPREETATTLEELKKDYLC